MKSSVAHVAVEVAGFSGAEGDGPFPGPVELDGVADLEDEERSVGPVSRSTFLHRSRFHRTELRYSRRTASAASSTNPGGPGGRLRLAGNLARSVVREPRLVVILRFPTRTSGHDGAVRPIAREPYSPRC